MVAAAAAIAAAAIAAGVPAAAQEACWSAAELAARRDEARIQKRVPGARQPPPTGIAASPGPIGPRGVIRRVALPPDRKLVALTFDLCEGPDEIAGYQGDIVDLLRRENVAATFFAGGKWLLTHPARAQQLMADRRFEIANHGWEHRNLRLLSGTRLADEIERAQLAYEIVRRRLDAEHAPRCIVPGGGTLAGRAVPARPSLFRFPFGACDVRALEAVSELGLRAVQWDVSSGDPSFGQTAPAIAGTVLGRVRPGSIVLFHANGRGWHTPAALATIVAALRARGYAFVTVSELLREGTPVVESACWDSRPGDTDRYDDLARRLEIRQRIPEALAAGDGAGPPPAVRPAAALAARAVRGVPLPPARPARPAGDPPSGGPRAGGP